MMRRRAMLKRLGAMVVTYSVLLVPAVDATPRAGATGAPAQTQEGGVIRRPIPKGRDGAQRFVRTELFFGTAKPVGAVTEEEFRGFLDREVTPRFPDGLTLIKGSGQFRGENGIVIKEDSWVLVLLYPFDAVEESSRQIETLRQLYMAQFQQESVLRVDDPFAVWVSF